MVGNSKKDTTNRKKICYTGGGGVSKRVTVDLIMRKGERSTKMVAAERIKNAMLAEQNSSHASVDNE